MIESENVRMNTAVLEKESDVDTESERDFVCEDAVDRESDVDTESERDLT